MVLRPQTPDAVACVDHQIGLGSTDVPDVRLEHLVDPMLLQARHIVLTAVHLEPRAGDGERDHRAHARAGNAIDAAGPRRQCALDIEAL